MCVKQREGDAIVFNCGDVACVEASLARLAALTRGQRRQHVIRQYWQLRGFNPHASPAELREARRVKVYA
jgi:hypothetical protein